MPKAKNMKYILYLDLDAIGAQIFERNTSPAASKVEEHLDGHFALSATLKLRGNNLLVMDSDFEGAHGPRRAVSSQFSGP